MWVSISPSEVMKKKFGMMVTSVGIIRALSRTRKMIVLPLKAIRAKA